MLASVEELREKVAISCRILGRPVPDISQEDTDYFTGSKERRSFERSDKGKAEMPHEQWQWQCYLERLSDIQPHDVSRPG